MGQKLNAFVDSQLGKRNRVFVDLYLSEST